MANPDIQTVIDDTRKAAQKSRYLAAGGAAAITVSSFSEYQDWNNRLNLLGVTIAGGVAIYHALRSNDLSNRATAYEAAMLSADPDSVKVAAPESFFRDEDSAGSSSTIPRP